MGKCLCGLFFFPVSVYNIRRHLFSSFLSFFPWLGACEEYLLGFLVILRRDFYLFIDILNLMNYRYITNISGCIKT